MVFIFISLITRETLTVFSFVYWSFLFPPYLPVQTVRLFLCRVGLSVFLHTDL